MDQVTLVKKQYRLEHRVKLVQECQSSGMRINDWCDANGITRHAYYYWLRKVRQAACQELSPVHPPENPTAFKQLEVHSPDAGTRLRSSSIYRQQHWKFGMEPASRQLRQHFWH